MTRRTSALDLIALVLSLVLGTALAQRAPNTGEVWLDGPPPAIVSLGLVAGFPADRTAVLRAGLQAGAIGVDTRVGYGPQSGLAFGAALRGYPPIPGVPVPVWLGAGLMASETGVRPFAAAGVHVPLAQRIRFDVEAGAAWVPLGLETQIVPHVQVGVSYAFAVDLRPVSASDAEGPTDPRATTEAQRCEPTDPDPELLDEALLRATERFIRDARATYGSLYRSLRYAVDVTDRRVDDDRATLLLTYQGSVVEIATGRRIGATGEAEAGFRWSGCSWSWISLSY